MLPNISDDLAQDYAFEKQPSKTFKIDFEKNRITGFTDGLDAVKQAVFLILNTPRYKYEIYSWNYGSELAEAIGCPVPLVFVRIKDYITEALMQDDRIISVGNFEFDKNKSQVYVAFTVGTELGAFSTGTEVTINV